MQFLLTPEHWQWASRESAWEARGLYYILLQFTGSHSPVCAYVKDGCFTPIIVVIVFDRYGNQVGLRMNILFAGPLKPIPPPALFRRP